MATDVLALVTEKALLYLIDLCLIVYLYLHLPPFIFQIFRHQNYNETGIPSTIKLADKVTMSIFLEKIPFDFSSMLRYRFSPRVVLK